MSFDFWDAPRLLALMGQRTRLRGNGLTQGMTGTRNKFLIRGKWQVLLFTWNYWRSVSAKVGVTVRIQNVQERTTSQHARQPDGAKMTKTVYFLLSLSVTGESPLVRIYITYSCIYLPLFYLSCLLPYFIFFFFSTFLLSFHPFPVLSVFFFYPLLFFIPLLLNHAPAWLGGGFLHLYYPSVCLYIYFFYITSIYFQRFTTNILNVY